MTSERTHKINDLVRVVTSRSSYDGETVRILREGFSFDWVVLTYPDSIELAFDDDELECL